MELRDYQILGKQMIYTAFQEGFQRIIYWAATGSGKTVSFCDIAGECSRNGLPVVIVMRRRELIFQTSKTLDEFNVKHGVYMAGHHRFRPKELVQVCSVDTLDARSLYPHADKKDRIVIVDECHDASPRSKKYAKLFDNYVNDHVIGYTATPFNDNSLFEKIICPIENHELRDQGRLVPERTFVPSLIDVSGVSIKSNGEFNEKELFEISSKKEVIGDFIRDWKLYAQGRPTLFFAVNIEHSKMVCEMYNEAGIKSAHIDAKTKSPDRKRMFDRLAQGKINVLCNVNVASTGVDIPEVSCIQIGRPTQSVIWHLQAIGRGLRTAPHVGKQDCIIIDNAGNTLRHGGAYRPREAVIGKPPKRRPDDVDVNIRVCKSCHFIFKSSIRICPQCGHMNPIVVRSVNNTDGDLEEYKLSEEELALINKRNFVNDYHKLSHVSKIRNFKPDWKYHKLKEKYGLPTCQAHGQMIDMPKYIMEG